MKRALRLWLVMGIVATCSAAQGAHAAGEPPVGGKVMVVIFENTDYRAAMAQSYFMDLASTSGANLTNLYAETHPSQPNYIALTSGDMFNVRDDNNVTVDATNLADLLEAKGKTWKVYAEAYPGNCFLGASRGTYARKHVPFLSYKNIQTDPQRCARIVPATQLAADIAADSVPDFSLYIPDQNNDGHDTGVAYANTWYQRTFGPLLKDVRFANDMLLISTFDESSNSGGNHIYTSFIGPQVQPRTTYATRASHYTILRTIEAVLDLDTLGRNDDTATPVTGIWK